ncbi:Spo0B C-terminal domain-containing protein [Halalkalibacter nanhaiisediminis]|uniref:Stage 0 sporulation protein B (Sporulation initiation phosphotransferase) n=1 Tax=Halalkalibacter nanhaiisediminis TaxID=688079 RepID=A0A562QJM6_9BACI|nr:Spo0B C-terminal domain-containing protein [Halalkalibacter nanhaiisediminis]TWI56246.1 stage 0 sporulation protein B (sporulation initiation phosphotransferase) [Halalkalibacter nanhaiisediminis]
MADHIDIIEALRHTRHDWLNVMQLIKGNLALERYDRIEEIINEVARQASCESKISNIQAPSVVHYLLTYNWYCRQMKLEIDVVGDVFSLADKDEHLFRLCKKIMEKLTDESAIDTENHLLLTFLFTDGHCELTFDYQGTLQNREDWLNDLLLREPDVELLEANEHECVLLTRFTRS